MGGVTNRRMVCKVRFSGLWQTTKSVDMPHATAWPGETINIAANTAATLATPPNFRATADTRDARWKKAEELREVKSEEYSH